MKEIFDPIRKKWVAATPEEIVRQRWLHKMVSELNFPRERIVVERELKMLPHLHHAQLPTRRIDILSFGKEMIPLLLIECKDGLISQEAIRQALAYNTFIGARYVAVVNHDEIRMHHQTKEILYLPNYQELLHG